MHRKCRVPGRNYCAPGGKIAALLVDLDGTLVRCQKNFDSAKRRYQKLMNMCGLNGRAVRKLAQKIELEHIEKNGFVRQALAVSMVKAYRQACLEAGKKPESWIIETCQDIGDRPFFRKPELFDDAAQVLTRVHHNFFIIAVTIGDRAAQQYKIKQAGLRAIFDDIIVTQYDNKSEMVASAIEALGISPEYSLFIGNSRRSDGQCLSQTNFLHLPLEGWVFDHAELPLNSKFSSTSARNWREAEEKGINHILRKRLTAMDTEELEGEKRRGCHESRKQS